jgi:hypothetical protein
MAQNGQFHAFSPDMGGIYGQPHHLITSSPFLKTFKQFFCAQPQKKAGGKARPFCGKKM